MLRGSATSVLNTTSELSNFAVRGELEMTELRVFGGRQKNFYL